MKKTIITLCLTLCAIIAFSQNGKVKTSAKSEFFVIEGLITDIPKRVMAVLFKHEAGETNSWIVDTVRIRKGKFRFKVKPDGRDGEYCIGIRYKGIYEQSFRNIFATPGTITKVTGSGLQVAQWDVENDNPYQKEDNAYNKLFKEIIREEFEFDKVKQAYADSLRLLSDKNSIMKLRERYATKEKEYIKRDSLNIVMFLEFLEQNKYNPPYVQRLHIVSRKIFQYDFHNLRDRARTLLYKIPAIEANKKLIASSLELLYPKYDKIKPGNVMPDIPFYDCDNKEHHFSEFYGNGKYKIVEIHGRHSGNFKEWRAKEWLDYLHENYSDKIDILFFNTDSYKNWKKSCGNKKANKDCDPWIEWSEHNNGVDLKEIFRVYHPLAFFSPDGKFLGIRQFFSLKDGIEEYLPFVDITKVK